MHSRTSFLPAFIVSIGTAGCSSGGSPTTETSSSSSVVSIVPSLASVSPTTPSPSAPHLNIAPGGSIAGCAKKNESACKLACDANDLRSCFLLGDLLIVSSDKAARAGCEAPLRKACEGKIGKACSTLTRCLPLDSPKAPRAKLNEQACNLNDGQGCFNIARNYEQGYGVEKDEIKAAGLMKKALELLPAECDNGDARSCLSMALLYDPITKSTRVEKDLKKAAALYKKACDGGNPTGCHGVERTGPPDNEEGSGTVDANCRSCSTQEDFDSVLKAGSKCCPTMACSSDSDCSGGRVCCKIPGGQLCGDSSRCKGSNRVSN